MIGLHILCLVGFVSAADNGQLPAPIFIQLSDVDNALKGCVVPSPEDIAVTNNASIKKAHLEINDCSTFDFSGLSILKNVMRCEAVCGGEIKAIFKPVREVDFPASVEREVLSLHLHIFGDSFSNIFNGKHDFCFLTNFKILNANIFNDNIGSCLTLPDGSSDVRRNPRFRKGQVNQNHRPQTEEHTNNSSSAHNFRKKRHSLLSIKVLLGATMVASGFYLLMNAIPKSDALQRETVFINSIFGIL